MNTKILKAKEWRGTCLACGKTFSYADGFDCDTQPGRHTVESKEYFHLGGVNIQAQRDRRQYQVMLNLQADIEVRDKVTGQITRLEGIMVQFNPGGKYETADPLEQYHLDMHPSVFSGPQGKDAWEKVYLTQEQQLQKAQAQLAEQQKQIRENNALLERQQLQKQGERHGVGVR